jgi:hypothetical protein
MVVICCSAAKAAATKFESFQWLLVAGDWRNLQDFSSRRGTNGSASQSLNDFPVRCRLR